MRQSVWKKAVAAALVAAMTTGLAACGGGSTNGGGSGNASSDGTQRYFKATYLDDLPDTFSENVSDVRFKGDMLYYGTYDTDYTTYSICSYNMVSNEAKTLSEVSVGGTDTSASVYSYAVTDSGDVYYFLNRSEIDTSGVAEDYSNATLDDVLAYFTDTWGYGSTEEAQQEWDSYYAEQYTNEDGTVDYGKFLTVQNASWIYKSFLVKVDASGNQVFEQEMSSDDGTSSNSSCSGMAVDAEGNVYVAMDTWDDTSDEYYILVFGTDGTQKGKITLDGYISELVTLADGTVAVFAYGDTDYELTPVDLSAMALNTDGKIAVPSSSGTISVMDEDNVLMTEGTSLYQYNTKTQEKELYLNWMDCNISSSSVNSYSVLSDGTLAAFVQNWYSSGNSAEIALIKEVDESEVADTVYLTMACLYTDYELEAKMIEFNKKQDKYHITMKTYGDGDGEYEDMVNSFTTAITTDTSIDMVMFNDYAQAMNFAAKGLGTDLYTLIDADSDMSRDDFFSNILSACEYDGKLAFLPQAFTLQTVVGKADDVGTTPGWTIDDMKTLLSSKADGTELFQGVTRADMLSTCVSAAYNSLVDLENTDCHFDSQEFIDILEFAAMFPEEYEWTEDTEDLSVLLNQGKVLLAQYYLGDFDEMQLYRAVYGGDITFIGYPNSTGSNGALLSLNSPLAITTNCKDVDGAWQFLRTLYLPEDEDSEDSAYYGSYGFSVRKDEFEKYCDEAMHPSDENGGSTYGWGEFEVEITAATQADVDLVKDLVNNTTSVYGAVSDSVLNIITEEAAAYFSGQKSASDVASVIQSRMKVYLSETK